MRRNRVAVYRDGSGVAAFVHYQRKTLGLESGLSFGIANKQLLVVGRGVCIRALNYARQ